LLLLFAEGVTLAVHPPSRSLLSAISNLPFAIQRSVAPFGVSGTDHYLKAMNADLTSDLSPLAFGVSGTDHDKLSGLHSRRVRSVSIAFRRFDLCDTPRH
jgi:hypothetical protein